MCTQSAWSRSIKKWKGANFCGEKAEIAWKTADKTGSRGEPLKRKQDDTDNAQEAQGKRRRIDVKDADEEVHRAAEKGRGTRRKVREVTLQDHFTCETCRTKVPATCKAFQLHTLGATTWCRQCKKSWMAKTWFCSCGVRWYQCPQHALGSQHKASITDKTETLPRIPQRRKAVRQDVKDEGFEALDSVSKGQRAITEECGQRVLRTSMLSANLKRKFSHRCIDA